MHLPRRLEEIRDAGVGRKITGVEIDGEPFPALNNVKWAVTADGDRDRQGHLGDLLAAPREEHRLRWVPAESATGHLGGRSRPSGGPRTAMVVRDAVRRPEQGDPRLLRRRIIAASKGRPSGGPPGQAVQALVAIGAVEDLRSAARFER